MTQIPTYADVQDAVRQLKGMAVRTPLGEAHVMGAALGCRLFVKPEVLQRTGSFKFRGAYNRISRLSEAERKRGVVAYSSGNHAQGVAAAAALVGAPSVIVMPSDAPAIKVANTKALGGEVVLYDRFKESREEIGQSIASERGLTLVKPYDDPYVIAGQGTAGQELVEQAKELGITPDIVVTPCGGGGLVAGCALAVKENLPNALVYGAEPVGLDDTARSLSFGQRVSNNPKNTTICDALMAPMPGEITFEVNRKLLKGVIAVSDDEVLSAMKRAFLDLKLVVEPGGAVALTAALTGKIDVRGKTVVVVCSGGNVDPIMFERALKAA